ncbi:MAG: 30S ribosomal protein S12 methylthiotransferase RimO [Clostridiales bacterium]|nr:30S ribosomal protein S12 methylthiotransferase RimO [Clostridiales bacterium]
MADRKSISVALIALGCSKNLIDAEYMVSMLKEGGFTVVDDVNEADVAVINTCGFIESAKTEAINTILDIADLKEDPKRPLEHIIVSGCLPQRYSGDILKEMPEVDIVLGTAHYKDICEAVSSLYKDKEYSREYSDDIGGLSHVKDDRYISTSGYAWLKIAEGCLHRCSFCAIPLIRGKYISRPIEDILTEAKNIVAKGYKEIILAAQDTTNYGIDLYGKRSLPGLLRELSKIDGIEVIRMMYGYMDGIDDELISEIRDNPKVAKYLDIPIQHADNDVLKRMYRGDTSELITERIGKLRSEIPGIILRTTVMVGFPGETEEQFGNLLDRLREWKFDRLGCFIFSPEEGTKAFDMPDQIDEQTKQQRYDAVYSLQQQFSLESNKSRIGEETEVTIDSISDDGIFYVGRSYGEAPDVDPCIYVVASTGELKIGGRYKVKIVDAAEYEMTGVTL